MAFSTTEDVLREKVDQSSLAMEKNKILFVDDEAFILFSLRRLFKQHAIDVDVETDAIKAIELLKENKYKVIVSDFRMPVMDGANFLQLAKDISPQSVRLVLSAHINQDSLGDIVNKCEIYRFVNKPWRDIDLVKVILDSLEKYENQENFNDADSIKKDVEKEDSVAPEISCINIARELPPDDFIKNFLPEIDLGSMDVNKQLIQLRGEQHQFLSYIINLTSSRIGLHCKRVAQLSTYVGKQLKLEEGSLKDLYFAALYHDIGKVFELVAQADHSELGGNILSVFSELKNASNIVRNHHKRLDEGESGVTLESKILAIVDHFDKEVSRDNNEDEVSRTLSDILANMFDEKGVRFDEEVLIKFKEIILKDFKLDMFFNETKIHINDLEDGMMLSRPLFNIDGKMLLNSEYKITKEVIGRIFKHNKIVAIRNPIFVFTKSPEKAFSYEEFIGKKLK